MACSPAELEKMVRQSLRRICFSSETEGRATLVENTNEDLNEDESDHSEKDKVLAWTKRGARLMGVGCCWACCLSSSLFSLPTAEGEWRRASVISETQPLTSCLRQYRLLSCLPILTSGELLFNHCEFPLLSRLGKQTGFLPVYP